MNNDFNEQPSGPEKKEYKFLWMRFKKPERGEVYQSLFGIIAIVIGAGLAALFPQKNCTCEDQITDLRLETLARQGNKQVMYYQRERESVIICAAKREELLKKLEQEKRRHPKNENRPD